MCLNYGCSTTPNWGGANVKWLNSPTAVATASNKINTFKTISSIVSTPEWTTDREIAKSWQQGGRGVVCRTILNGHSGAGIVLTESDAELPVAPLYVKYIPKEYEYRVHVFNGKVIDVQQKRKRTNYEGEVNTKIRNHHTGWVYCRQSYVAPPCIAEMEDHCIKAVKALGLNFGAVDVIYSKKNNKFYILEVNTAPGMEGETLNVYAKAILEAV